MRRLAACSRWRSSISRRDQGYPSQNPASFSIRAAASSTSSPYRFPGCRVVLSMGPETLTAATTEQRSSLTGALTDATPASRSATLCTHTRVSRASCRVRPSPTPSTCPPPCPPDESDPSVNTRPAEPTPSGNDAPSGTIVRRPCGDSIETMQIRLSPSRTYNCTLSPVVSRRSASAGRAEIANGIASTATRPSEMRRTPSMKRPWSSRRTSPCISSATANRCVVARERPVRSTRSDNEEGPASSAFSTEIDLSSTPTPLTLDSTYQD